MSKLSVNCFDSEANQDNFSDLHATNRGSRDEIEAGCNRGLELQEVCHENNEDIFPDFPANTEVLQSPKKPRPHQSIHKKNPKLKVECLSNQSAYQDSVKGHRSEGQICVGQSSDQGPSQGSCHGSDQGLDQGLVQCSDQDLVQNSDQGSGQGSCHGAGHGSHEEVTSEGSSACSRPGAAETTEQRNWVTNTNSRFNRRRVSTVEELRQKFEVIAAKKRII